MPNKHHNHIRHRGYASEGQHSPGVQGIHRFAGPVPQSPPADPVRAGIGRRLAVLCREEDALAQRQADLETREQRLAEREVQVDRCAECIAERTERLSELADALERRRQRIRERELQLRSSRAAA